MSQNLVQYSITAARWPVFGQWLWVGHDRLSSTVRVLASFHSLLTVHRFPAFPRLLLSSAAMPELNPSPVALLRAHSRHAPWNARGLAAHVTALVDAAGIRPTNASARSAPSARSVRFYVASGLLDRPEGAGTAATYNYRHLLQLLAIKLRQREGATLDTIKTEMKDVTGDALERRVASSLAPALGAHADLAVQNSDDDRPASWRRFPVADGIELHVRDGAPAAREEALIAMREAVRAALGRADIR